MSQALRLYQKQAQQIGSCLVKQENGVSSCIVRTGMFSRNLVLFMCKSLISYALLIVYYVKPFLCHLNFYCFTSKGRWVIDSKKNLIIAIGIPWRIPGGECFLLLGNGKYINMAAFQSSTFILAFLSTGHGIYVCNICAYCLAVKGLGKTYTIICHSLL